MSAAGGSGSGLAPEPARTLEEQLRRAHDQLCLVADLFDLQAVAPDADGLSVAACAALGALYRQASQELRATLATLPAALLNWEPTGEPGPDGCRPGRG